MSRIVFLDCHQCVTTLKEFHLVKNPPKYTCEFVLGLEVVCSVEDVKDAPLVLWYYTIVKFKPWDTPSVIHINN